MTNEYVIDDIRAPLELLGRRITLDNLFSGADGPYFMWEAPDGRRERFGCCPVQVRYNARRILPIGPELTGRESHAARQHSRCLARPVGGRYVSRFSPGAARRIREAESQIAHDKAVIRWINRLLATITTLDNGERLSPPDRMDLGGLKVLMGLMGGGRS